jgi:DNA replication initiation complex subunit (GINS family)
MQEGGEGSGVSGRYDRLLEAWRRERHRRDLQPLQEGFYGEMTDYVSQLREQTRMIDKSSIRGRISDKEKDHAERLLRELSQLRLRKIVGAELDGEAITGSSLTREERALHADLRTVLSGHEERLKSILMGRVPQVDAKPPPRSDQKVVRFLQAVPAIMGIDMKTYGPFKPEDVVSLPVENAENLIRRGIAKEVEIPK